MPLLMLDLDNTLIDQDAAFRGWFVDFLAGRGVAPGHADGEVSWAMQALAERTRRDSMADVAAAVVARYGMAASDVEVTTAAITAGIADRVAVDSAAKRELAAATAQGWVTVIVTNGRVAVQEAKLRAAGLHELVAGWVVEESVGVGKPAPEIFRAAAEVGRSSLDGAWMIGDNATNDIGGAAALGLRTVWIRRARQWREPEYQPTRTAGSAAKAIAGVLADDGG